MNWFHTKNVTMLNWAGKSPDLKGGESSSQFRWFTIAKIELQFLIIFCFNFGIAVANIFYKYKKISSRKKLLETLSFDLPANTTVSLMV